MKPTFNYCSLKYLNMYQIAEKEQIDGFMSTDSDVRVNMLKKAASGFNVARNFKNFESHRAAISVALHNHHRPKNELETIELVNKFAGQLSKIVDEKRKFFSASSKFLWLKFQSPIVIIDSRTIKAIDKNLKPEDYKEYFVKWQLEFNKHAEEIKSCCLELPKLKKYSYNPAMQIDEIVSSKWFHERVFDIYLWEIGVNNQSANL